MYATQRIWAETKRADQTKLYSNAAQKLHKWYVVFLTKICLLRVLLALIDLLGAGHLPPVSCLKECSFIARVKFYKASMRVISEQYWCRLPSGLTLYSHGLIELTRWWYALNYSSKNKCARKFFCFLFVFCIEKYRREKHHGHNEIVIPNIPVNAEFCYYI